MKKNEIFSIVLRKNRPVWQRVLIWLGLAFVLFNTLGVVLFMVSPIVKGALLRLALVVGVVAIPLWKWGGLNVLRTWSNAATASFMRREDPTTGGCLFDVQPARAARLPALPLFAVGLFLLLYALLVGARSTGGFVGLYVVALVCIGVGYSFVLPGARDRKSVQVSVYSRGIRSGDIDIPLTAVADLRVAHGGLVVDPDPLMPGPNGVPISSIAGRHMGRRQAARGYTIVVRADGESKVSILAGGLTENSATALVTDIRKAMDEVAQTRSA